MKTIDIDIESLGFIHIGSGWWKNQKDDIRLRFWNNSQLDFYRHYGKDDVQVRFKGVVRSLKDVEWILERCFELYV